jgi:hypothetical protein
VSEEEKYSIPEEVEEWIGLKKSEYLSKLIENVKEGDFGFEEYHLFDHKIQETVEHPDRSFEGTDDSYVIQTFIRTYSDEKMFHHVVVGSTYVDKKNEVEVFLPILSFVTRSENVVGVFSVGTPKARPTLN